MPKIYNMSVPQLIKRGWSIGYDARTGLPVTINATIPDWSELSWAEQTYYRGKYLFDENGALELRLPELIAADEKTLRHFVRDLFPDKNVTPDGALADSNERLREILEQSRIGIECRSYDDTALVHIGPDDSAIYTNEAGWGPPSHWPDDKVYVELDDSRTCWWEIGPSWVSEAPCWTCPPCNGF